MTLKAVSELVSPLISNLQRMEELRKGADSEDRSLTDSEAEEVAQILNQLHHHQRILESGKPLDSK